MHNNKVTMFVHSVMATFVFGAVLYCKTRKHAVRNTDELLKTDDVMGKIVQFTCDKELGSLSRVNRGLSSGIICPILEERKDEFEIRSIISELRAEDYENEWSMRFGNASDAQLMSQLLNGFDGIVHYILYNALQAQWKHQERGDAANDTAIAELVLTQTKLLELKTLLSAYKSRYVDLDETHPMRMKGVDDEFMTLFNECNELVAAMESACCENEHALMHVWMHSSNLKYLFEGIAIKIGVPGIIDWQRDLADTRIGVEHCKVNFGGLKRMISNGTEEVEEGSIEWDAVRILVANEELIDAVITLVEKLEEYTSRLEK